MDKVQKYTRTRKNMNFQKYIKRYSLLVIRRIYIKIISHKIVFLNLEKS